MKDKLKLFISHVTPEDNYFTAWLSSKLKLLGYQVWVELDELKSGDAFWPEIEDAIRSQSIKFIPVISHAYIEKVKDSTSGVFKELSCADRIKGINNFKSPVRIESVEEDNFPVQIMGLHSVDFYNNWQTGLENLLESFEKEKIPKEESTAENPLPFWLDAFKVKDILNQKEETVYTNWFPFSLPDKLYIHKPIIKNKIDQHDIAYSYLEYSDRHICFFPRTDYPTNIECLSSFEFDIKNIWNEQVVPVDDFLAFNEPRKKIVELINKIMGDYFFQQGTKKYEQANETVYYFPATSENKKRISLKSIGKTNVAVTGKNKEVFWSFGISSYSILYPFPYLKISSHIIFESEGFQPLEQDDMFGYRRQFGTTWFNRDWLDTLLGMMMKISGMNTEHKLLVPVGNGINIIVEAMPYNMQTNFGYDEPEKVLNDD